MCGIVGYIGCKNATPILVDALKKLEYRGYDSAGIAVLSGDELIVKKTKGALKFLVERIIDDIIKESTAKEPAAAEKENEAFFAEAVEKTAAVLPGTVGIGHTRWATHGEPSDTNAHPHINESGAIAVVHNGIIENHAKLRSWLQSQGIVFRSQTDTEVVAHLTNYFYEKSKNIFTAVQQTLQKLEGSYALAVICRDFPDRIVVARKDCPLVVGLGKGENFIASDVPAIIERTRDVYFLEQKELAVLYADHVDLFSENGEKIVRAPFHVDWDVSAAKKDGYSHFMLKEIHEQPKALRDTMNPRLVRDENGTIIDINFEEMQNPDFWKNVSRVVIAACGTASYAGQVAKYVFEKFARLPVEVDVASEYRYRNPVMFPSDLFIVISQSGETADTLAAMRLAKTNGARVVAVTNCVGSTISREADDVVYTWAGPEIAVASTKAFTAQVMCMYLLALKCAAVRGTIAHEDYLSALRELEAIPEKVEEILKNQSKIQKLASQQFNKEKIFYIGRQFDSAICMECALKLKEVSYMHSESFAAGELKHGPIALVDPSTLVVAVATQKALFDKIASNIVEVQSRGAATMVITQDDTGYFSSCAEYVSIPAVDDAFAPLLSVIPAQLFAYYCSVLRGNDPDKPRNLAKSVTVE
ncbi:MAG: glutamine--fructose-6-phosphate transaminase (isomerizing) [Spirochaetaceae bacterium]|nr:glutamine--fructose-6-phosphate transaminase (isomerizing) [Spirochaetaceae bacterium]